MLYPIVCGAPSNIGPIITYTLPAARITYFRVSFSILAHALRLLIGACGTTLANEKLCAIALSVPMSAAGAMWPRSNPESLYWTAPIVTCVFPSRPAVYIDTLLDKALELTRCHFEEIILGNNQLTSWFSIIGCVISDCSIRQEPHFSFPATPEPPSPSPEYPVRSNAGAQHRFVPGFVYPYLQIEAARRRLLPHRPRQWR